MKRQFVTNMLSRSIGYRRSLNILSNRRCFSNSEEKPQLNTVNNSKLSNAEEETISWGNKIIYNTFLENYGPKRSWREEANEKWRKPMREAAQKVELYSKDIPISLKYLEGSQELFTQEDTNRHSEEENIEPNQSNQDQFPYKVYTKFIVDESTKSKGFRGNQENNQGKSKNSDEEIENEEIENEHWEIQYGSADPEIPASSVPCGGCGAYLHCQDTAIPGFMPAESFTAFSDRDLQGEICQRCFYLRNHNAALNVNVSPKDYPEILKQIENHFALVLLVVDLLDFPCSIWPDIVNIIGVKRPVLIVGNKVDLLPRDSKFYLNHIRSCLEKVVMDSDLGRANIVGVELISATTGFGIEDLISTIYGKWKIRGDVFIMGCTNVGKSSLFNIFLQSDLCKIQVVDLVHRATISPWPGTTLNLLKFPILKMSQDWKLTLRNVRLKYQKEEYVNEQNLQLMKLKKTRDPAYATLMGRVGRTFLSEQQKIALKVGQTISNDLSDLFHVNPYSKGMPHGIRKLGKWDRENPALFGQWCYDTPGAVGENQMLDLFTLSELMKILPKDLIKPRSFYIKLGMTLFVGGIVRLDYVDGVQPIRYTIFSSSSLPITVCNSVDADDTFANAFGTPVFGVPMGNSDRLSKFPPLKSTTYELVGIGHKESCADIVISSTGFVAVTAGRDENCRLMVYSPNGKGVYCRQPSLLPFTINKKGKRIRDTPAYARHRVYIPF